MSPRSWSDEPRGDEGSFQCVVCGALFVDEDDAVECCSEKETDQEGVEE